MTEALVRKRTGTTVDEVVELLRDQIISGELQPGMRLSQQKLADELSVSRTPLREALQRLASEGYVVTQANRGMVVAPVTLDHVEDGYSFRLLVEPTLTAAVIHSITRDDIAVMAKSLEDMERPGISIREFQEAHSRFHRCVLDHYPSYLADMVRQQHRHTQRQQRLYFSRPVVLADFTEIDGHFLKAIKDRDAARAEQLLEFHLLDAALGVLLEVEPDHEFSSLMTTLRGMGIQVQGFGGIGLHRPGRLEWHRRADVALPPLRTNNLEYQPAK